MMIHGYITRLIEPDQIFFRPDDNVDLRNVDGKHKLASGEMLVTGDIKVRKLGDRIACILSNEADPLATTLRIY